jgi:phosphatidate phosphatase APP1
MRLEIPAPGRGALCLTVAAEMKGALGKVYTGTGRVRLLEPEGMSVVSDIDDTIKVSEIPTGADIVLRNTFLRDYVAVEGMRDRYRRLGDVSLHYVSGSPWHMFGLRAIDSKVGRIGQLALQSFGAVRDEPRQTTDMTPSSRY